MSKVKVPWAAGSFQNVLKGAAFEWARGEVLNSDKKSEEGSRGLSVPSANTTSRWSRQPGRSAPGATHMNIFLAEAQDIRQNRGSGGWACSALWASSWIALRSEPPWPGAV